MSTPIPPAVGGSNNPLPALAPGRGAWLGNLGRDIRFSLRSLRRAPGFSAAVFSTLALCIGPNTAILAVLYSFVLKPLPFPAPEQLVVITNVAEKSGGAVNGSTVPQYLDFVEHADLFAGFGLADTANATIGEESTPVRASGNQVNTEFFQTLGIAPRLGRFFTPEEGVVGQEHVLVLTQTFWESRYNADPGVIGRVVRMGGEPFTIIGVAPRSLESLYVRTDFFRPYGIGPANRNPLGRYGGRATLIGRLKPGVTPAAGLAQLKALELRFRGTVSDARLRAYLDTSGFRLDLVQLRNENAAGLKKSLWLLEIGVIFVLLIGCVNAVNLWLARANAKRPELAIRHALGAGPGALMRQMVVESMLVTVAATLLGVGFAWGALQVINRYLPVIARSAPPVAIEPGVTVAIIVVALAIGFVMGLVPFLLLWRTGLKSGGSRTSSSSGAIRALSSALVITQVAVALVLLVGAGLLIRSFANVMAIHPGFDAVHTIQARVALPRAYDKPADNAGVRQRIMDKMKEISGVESVASVAYFGVGPESSFRSTSFSLRGSAALTGENRPLVIVDPVSAGFFETMNVHLLEGRLFTDGDNFAANSVVIVDQPFAERYFSGQSAVGQELAFGAGPFPDTFKWPRIIGVVARANLAGLEGRDGLPFVYVPMAQQPSPGFNLLVHSTRPAGDVIKEMRSKLREVDPTLPLYNESTLQATLDGMLMTRRGIMLLLGVFSGLALLLAGVGLYGVLAYDVSQRTREIGIRGAIGASRAQITVLILRQGLWKSGLGLGLGLIGAFFLTRTMRSLLFDVAPADPVSFIGVPLLLIAVAALASWLPARRAAKVDPIVALRCE